MTEAEKAKFVAWINERQRNPLCEVCGQNNWALGEHLLHGQIFTGGGLVIGGPSYPQTFIVCQNCANVRTFMAVPMGIGLSQPDSSQTEGGDG